MSTDADASFQPRHLGRYHDDMQQGGLADHQQHPQPHTSYLPLSRFSSSQTPHDSGGYPHSMPPPPAQYPNYPAIPGPSRVGAGSSSSAHYNPSSSSSSSRAPVQQQQSSQMRFDVETGHDSTFNDASESTSRIPDKTSRSSRSHDTGPHSHATLTRSSGEPHLDIFRTETDSFGNAGLTTFRSGMDVRYMEYWGVTSYLGIQDLVSRMLETKRSHASDPQDDRPFSGGPSESPELHSNNVWRWGVDRYITHDHIESVLPGNQLDPIFLPAELAYRFFNAYKTVIHPLFPVLRIDAVRESIYGAYTLGVAELKPRQLDNLAYKSDRLERARDLMVLAFGAQIEGGDGDAQCHKDVARAWSEVLVQKAKEIMLEHGQGKGGVDLVNLWVVMAAFGRSYGNSDEELASIGQASRLATSIGLTREGVYKLPVADEHGFRLTICVCYHMEKWASLCHGIPSNMVRSPEFNSIISGLTDNRYYLIPLVGLADLMSQVQAMFDEFTSSTSVQVGISRAINLHQSLVQFRARMPEDFDHFENAPQQRTRIDLDTPEGARMVVRFTMCGIYLQLKMLVLMPILEASVWATIRQQSLAYSDEMRVLANECVAAALAMLHAFERYYLAIPHLTELSLSAILLLYAISIIYMDILRLPQEEAIATYSSVVRTMSNILDHYDHPAAHVAQAMCNDILANQLQRPAYNSFPSRA
ncbi:hypothetical protein FFLO_06454 [Filobasidium floriforme]|uniref:Transcription factor domain-containing protein n=1 Tax=Filobasidium floriforme TaxID=5210 RepID=A0A8K0JEU8_9TREE|nr:hypothetical protein FFLO_06454 [Filobasidium floriforme]